MLCFILYTYLYFIIVTNKTSTKWHSGAWKTRAPPLYETHNCIKDISERAWEKIHKNRKQIQHSDFYILQSPDVFVVWVATALPPLHCKSINHTNALLFYLLIETIMPRLFWHQRTKAPLTRSDSGDSDDNYVPMNPGSSPLSAAQADSPKNIYIPMSPGPHHFDFPGFSATLPARKGSSASLCHRPSRLSDVTPPPINRNLKPNRKCEFWQHGSHRSTVKAWVFIS